MNPNTPIVQKHTKVGVSFRSFAFANGPFANGSGLRHPSLGGATTPLSAAAMVKARTAAPLGSIRCSRYDMSKLETNTLDVGTVPSFSVVRGLEETH
jgi:hypothetical protein